MPEIIINNVKRFHMYIWIELVTLSYRVMFGT